MVGPMDFTMNDECGVLIEGFEREPMIRKPWHPPTTSSGCEAAGDAQGDGPADVGAGSHDRIGPMKPILPTSPSSARTKHGVTIRKMSRRHLRRDMDEFAKVYNAAWSQNWGFVPYSRTGLAAYTQEMHAGV